MHPLVLLCAAGSIGAIWVARHGQRDSLFTAVALFAGLGATNIAWLCDRLDALAGLDLVYVVWGLQLCKAAPWDAWRQWFLRLAFIQLGLDTVYETLGAGYYLGYMALYNLAFAFQLWAVASTGWPNVNVGRMADRRNRDL